MANQKYKIKGNNKIPGYDSELEVDVDDKYEAYSKEIPAPTPYQNGVITWFNNFGVREKSDKKNADVTYTVTLQAPPEGSQLFVFYGGQPHAMPTESGGNGKIKYTLNVGDPPNGFYP
jgi:hypothetical protein